MSRRITSSRYWPEVEAAMRRCKQGHPRPGDTELCERAYRSAPKEYGRRKLAVDEKVHQEERERWRI